MGLERSRLVKTPQRLLSQLFHLWDEIADLESDLHMNAMYFTLGTAVITDII